MTDHHPTGLQLATLDSRCGTCAWARPASRGWGCIAADRDGTLVPVNPGWPGCQLWEPTIPSCDPCGACCREAFDSVPVSEEDLSLIEDPATWVHAHDDGWRDVYRSPSPCGVGTHCKALSGDGSATSPFRCQIYAQRPTNCRDLAIGSEGCLMARRRVRLSPWHPEQSPEGPWASATASGNASAKKPG
jgi:hypothetical protein